MLKNRRNHIRLLLAMGVAASGALLGDVSDMTAECRNGQVFLQWKESALPETARLTVWGSSAQITRANVEKAEKLADLLNPRGAEDWWLNVENFLVNRSKKARAEENFAGNVADLDKKSARFPGFIIKDNGQPLDPNGGLHVHTPGAGQTGKRYFAVTWNDGASTKIQGFTALAAPVDVVAAPIRPIVLKGAWPKDCGKGLPLVVCLHGRGGGVGVNSRGEEVGNHILFVDKSLAWREGIPFKFTMEKKDQYVSMTLNDRVWAGRRLERDEISDSRDFVKAISTFWFGYNPNLAVTTKGPKYLCDNYTERYVLYLIKWAKEYLGVDPNRIYVTGGSMGGTGSVQLITHFPEVFAAASAVVPIYSYTWHSSKVKGCLSATRIRCSVGRFDAKNPAHMVDGRELLSVLDGAANIAHPEIDFPPLQATNGRTDSSMPWENNPPFYTAANNARQSVSIFWNNGNHGMNSSAPADMKAGYTSWMLKFRKNESFPAFSNCSDNKNYGKGEIDDGDLVGWINRGFDWKVIADTADAYEIRMTMKHPEIVYPVRTDVTIRQRQQFKPAKGAKVQAVVNGKAQDVVIDAYGLLTVPGVEFASAEPVVLAIKK